MAIDKVIAVQGSLGVVDSGAAKHTFQDVMKASEAAPKESPVSEGGEVNARLVPPQAVSQPCVTAGKTVVECSGRAVGAAPSVAGTPTAKGVSATGLLDQVRGAQRKLDHVLAQAQSGKNFTPAELLSLQAQVYRASQELDLAGKVVEKATGGVKQVLQTQV